MVVISNFTLELLPPDVTRELLQSFKDNEQGRYFDVFENIVIYNENLYTLKQVGFVTIILQFIRFVLYLSLHPRMAVLVNTMKALADNLYHFLLYFIFINIILVYLGWWMFAELDNLNYGTFMKTLYTQFRMLTGDFPFPLEMPNFALATYLILYTFMVFIILVNFLLAIVVGSYESVMKDVIEMETDQNVAVDSWDALRTMWKRRRYRYPSAKAVLMALDRNYKDMIDADDLSESMDRAECFHDVNHAENFLQYYADKIKIAGRRILVYEQPEKDELMEEMEGVEEKVDDIARVLAEVRDLQMKHVEVQGKLDGMADLLRRVSASSYPLQPIAPQTPATTNGMYFMPQDFSARSQSLPSSRGKIASEQVAFMATNRFTSFGDKCGSPRKPGSSQLLRLDI